MDELANALRTDDDAPDSPKRKKKRTKYTSKACVSCRRSKLKCSGQTPCQRCLDNGRQCLYDEAPLTTNGNGMMRRGDLQRHDAMERERRASDASVLGIAEVLQNLSRPTPAQPTVNANGSGVPRRTILPRQEGTTIERRASDASVLGISMEARMSRIEGMMEALIQERGVAMTPRGSMEREDTASDSLRGDSIFDTRLESIGQNSSYSRQHTGYHTMSPETHPRHSISTAGLPAFGDRSTIQIGNRTKMFPNNADWQKYIDLFFTEVNPYLPCVNETEFRSQSEQMLALVDIPETHACLLALNYMMFACIEALFHTAPANTATLDEKTTSPGWQPYQLAEELINSRKSSGRGGLRLIQVLVLEVQYLISTDKPHAASITMSLTSRLCFQHGLQQQGIWSSMTPFEEHMRQRIFWTIFIIDRIVALSCRQPYTIRDSDVDAQLPLSIDDQKLQSDMPLPEPDAFRTPSLYLRSMVSWAKFAGEVYDTIFSALATTYRPDEEKVEALDTRIEQFTTSNLPGIPLLPHGYSPEARHLRQHVLAYTRFNHLRLLLRRHKLLSHIQISDQALSCGHIAMDTIRRIKPHAPLAKIASSFRCYMATSLSHPLLILASLLLRDPTAIGIGNEHTYAEGFREARTMLADLASYHQVARRILDDFQPLIRKVGMVLNNRDIGMRNFEESFSPNDFPLRFRLGPPNEESGSTEAWDDDFQQRSNRVPGVLWI